MSLTWLEPGRHGDAVVNLEAITAVGRGFEYRPKGIFLGV